MVVVTHVEQGSWLWRRLVVRAAAAAGCGGASAAALLLLNPAHLRSFPLLDCAVSGSSKCAPPAPLCPPPQQPQQQARVVQRAAFGVLAASSSSCFLSPAVMIRFRARRLVLAGVFLVLALLVSLASPLLPPLGCSAASVQEH